MDSVYMKYRRDAFLWILTVVNQLKLSSMIRDKSFALLDVYFSEKFHNANVVTKETVSYAAIVSIYSAIKLNDPCHSITLDSFNGFDKEKLLSTQKIYWQNVVPEITTIPIIPPSECVVLYLLQWTNDDSLRSSVYAEADAAVVDFVVNCDQSMYYGPITIAVCAFIIAFSTLNIEANEFLNRVVPNNFFRCGNGLTMQENIDEFDVCMSIFKKNIYNRKRKIKAYSERHILKSEEMHNNWFSPADDIMNGLSSDSYKSPIEEEDKEDKILFNTFLLKFLKLAKDDALNHRIMETINNDDNMQNKLSLHDWFNTVQA